MTEKRYACTMWEFSWLVRRTGHEAEYTDWDRVLDELAERGYNCIRLDAFPHLIAAGPDGRVVEQFTVLPQPDFFMWGNHTPVTVEPHAALIEFIQKAKARDIYVGLSSWYNDDTLNRRLMINTPQDYARIWDETLKLLDGQGLLDRVVWVDLCNEFPLVNWAPGPYTAVFGAPPADLLGIVGVFNTPWTDPIKQAMERFFNDSINPLRAAYPQLKFTFSLIGLGSENIQQLDVSAFGITEPHIWLTDDMNWMQESGQVLALIGAPDAVPTHAAKMRELYPVHREEYYKILEARLDFWAAWANRKKLPLFTTEAWGPVNYDDVSPGGTAGEWDWVKDLCAHGVRLAVDKGWTGICTSNFCQPHFEGMWSDVAWHRQMTRLIRG